MVTLRSREVDTSSQATSDTHSRGRRSAAAKAASLADTAQTGSRRSSRLRPAEELPVAEAVSAAAKLSVAHRPSASTPFAPAQNRKPKRHSAADASQEASHDDLRPVSIPQQGLAAVQNRGYAHQDQGSTHGAGLPLNTSLDAIPEADAEGQQQQQLHGIGSQQAANGDDSDSDDSDASSMGCSPAPEALDQLTAAMWSIFGQQPLPSAIAAPSTQLSNVEQTAQPSFAADSADKGSEDNNFVETRWHPDAWMSSKAQAESVPALAGSQMLQDNFAGKLMVPPKDPKQEKRERKQHEASTAGSRWFNMKGTEMTAETKRDLQLLKLRGVYDPKRFYKSSDHKKGFPAHFQLGTVMEAPTEFYSGRLAKRDRKQTITQELLHDPDMNNARKRRFGNIQAERQSWSKKRKQHKKSKQKALSGK